jgi:hypothetical protein
VRYWSICLSRGLFGSGDGKLPQGLQKEKQNMEKEKQNMEKENRTWKNKTEYGKENRIWKRKQNMEKENRNYPLLASSELQVLWVLIGRPRKGGGLLSLSTPIAKMLDCITPRGDTVIFSSKGVTVRFVKE